MHLWPLKGPSWKCSHKLTGLEILMHNFSVETLCRQKKVIFIVAKFRDPSETICMVPKYQVVATGHTSNLKVNMAKLNPSLTRQTVTTLCHYPMFTHISLWFKHRTCLCTWCPHTSGRPCMWNTSQCTILQQMPQFTHNSTLKERRKKSTNSSSYSHSNILRTPISHNAQTGAVCTHHRTLFIGVSSARSHTPTHRTLKMITV